MSRKNKTAAAAAAAAIVNESTAVATVPPVQTEAQGTISVEMDATAFLSHVRFEGTRAILTDGIKPTVADIVNGSLALVEDSKSAGLRAGAVLRLSRTLPPITVVRGEGTSAKQVALTGWQQACELLKERSGSESAWFAVQSIPELLDIAEANELQCSPFIIREVIGYLRKVGAVNPETHKLLATDPIAALLLANDDKCKVNAIREPLLQAKLAQGPSMFPNECKREAAKQQALADAAAKASGQTQALVTTDGKAGPVAPEEQAPAQPKITPAQVARELTTVRGQWETLVSESKSPSATRAELVDACLSEFKALAALMGVELVLTPAQAGK